jgi:molybdate transport system substrate-binding protein
MFRGFGMRMPALACLCMLVANPARADEALVAVAANFAGAVEAIGAEFTKETGHTLKVTTGSTGKLYAQIGEGAPFTILLSADAKTPARLARQGKAVAGTQFTYAVGRLSLWSSDANRIGPDPKAALTAASTLHVAIANPDLAPYGVAAREALTAMGLWEEIQPKIEMGFVATSALLVPGDEPKGSRYDVPQEMFKPIEQDAILLNPGEGNAAAKAFMDYLKGEKAKSIAQSFGYGTE